MDKSLYYEYKCFNDCIQTGCPGHKMKLTYHLTSDTISLITLGHKDKNGEWCNDQVSSYDRSELMALCNAWEQLKRN